MTTKMLKLESLVRDFSMYPRSMVDDTSASQYAEHLLLGAEFPPIIVCKASLRIIDGFTRSRAYEKAGRDEIECELITVRDDKDFFERAAAANAQHGRRYTPFDIRRIIQRSRELGLEVDRICGAVQITPAHYEDVIRGFATTRAGQKIALKNTIKHMSGKVMTKKQTEANKRLSGMNQAFYVNQIIELIEADLIDTENKVLLERMKVLNNLLTGFLRDTEVA